MRRERSGEGEEIKEFREQRIRGVNNFMQWSNIYWPKEENRKCRGGSGNIL